MSLVMHYSLQDQEIQPDMNTIKYLSDLQFGQTRAAATTDLNTCQCEACKDRR